MVEKTTPAVSKRWKFIHTQRGSRTQFIGGWYKLKYLKYISRRRNYVLCCTHTSSIYSSDETEMNAALKKKNRLNAIKIYLQ